MESVKSISSVIIRLTDERWIHITENHPEMAGFYDEVLDTIEAPQSVYADDSELTEDGLIIRYEGSEVVGITVLNASKRR